MLSVGDQPFQLVARGAEAWSNGPAQEAAIIAAARVATGMRVEARDRDGRRFADRYLARRRAERDRRRGGGLPARITGKIAPIATKCTRLP